MSKVAAVKSGEPIIGPLGPSEKNKQWQRELLMERLRSHSSQHKSFQELSRAMRMSMLEKRYALDAVEKSNLQKCLDSMQHCIKVTTRQGLVERLESLSRQLGLKFMEDTSGLFISSDMFYLEIILDSDGTLSDVKVHHECKIEQQSCSELVTCLLKGDFADFTVQLEGLSSIYQLNAEPKVKSKAFVALQAMETDLYNLFTMQNFHKDTQTLLIDSLVGIVQKRRGGHSMKLIYFIPSYDLLNLEMKSMQTLTLDLISTKNIGMSVAVNLEASSANKLQILPTVTFNKDIQGESVPIYSPMNTINSTLLPATFVLRLNTPLPICKSLMSTLVHLNDNQTVTNNDTKLSSITDLIVQTASDGQIKNSSKGLFVNLPDQNHLYYFTENKSMKGSIVTSIPFTEPSQVPKILSVLRKQALFHTLLASCVRPLSRMTDLESTTMIEVNAISITQVSIALEHPFEESMATVEFDLNDGKNITCSIYSLTSSYDTIALKLSKIVQKSLSIPIAIRSLIKFWEQERLKGYHHRGMENGNFNLSLGPNDPGGRSGGGGGSSGGGIGGGSGPDFRDMKIKTERGGGSGGLSGIGGTGSNFNNSSGSRQFFHAASTAASGGMSNDGFTAVKNNLSIFEVSATGHNQFGCMKSSNETINDFQDQISGSSGVVTGFSTGEDFYKNPKSVFNNNLSSETSGDSSSLGTISTASTSDSGVTISQSFRKVLEKDAADENNSGNAAVVSSENKSMTDKRTNFKDNDNTTSKVDTGASLNSNSNVSITPMSANELTSVLTGMGLEKRPGIEIIPISTSNNQNFQTSITITPINVQSLSSSSSSKSSKKHGGTSSSKKSDDKLKSDKKRKRKKDDIGLGGQMGPPPEKLISKSDSINRSTIALQHTSTVKRDSPVSPNRNKHSSNSNPSSSSLAIMISNNSGSSTTKPSPKHSPAYSSSPKSQQQCGTSPKHTTLSGSSGKPSMLALKTATNSMTSPKGDKISSKLQTSSKDKDKERTAVRNLCGSSTSPKIKSSTVKLKQIDLSAAFLQHLESGGAVNEGHSQINDEISSIIPSSGNNSALIQSKMRKGSLSAVIDKLKSAQNSGDENIGGDLSKRNESDGLSSPDSIANSKLLGATNATAFGSEYMIKPSLDGMKITINKTRTKDALPSTQKISSPSVNPSSLKFSSFGGSGNASIKKHTGLKPNISSGPTSKKSVVTSLLKSTSPLLNNSNSFLTTKSNFHRTSSAGNLTSTKIGSIGASDLYRKEKSIKGSNKSVLGNCGVDSKQISNRTDPVDVMKILRLTSPNNSMDGFMKSLNTKFQIPKLSARTNDDPKKDTTTGATTSKATTIAQGTTTTATTNASTTNSIATTATTAATASSSSSMPAIASALSGNTSSNCEILTAKLSNESTSEKDFSATQKAQQQQPVINKSSSTETNLTQQQQLENIFNSIAAPSGTKISHFSSSSTSPKCKSNDTSALFKDNSLSQLSKSSSSDAILNTFRQKDYMIKPHSVSTPSTPLHVQSPFTSPVCATILNSSSSSVCKASPSTSPNVSSGSGGNIVTGFSCNDDSLAMRPPSAPCAIDMTKCGISEIDSCLKSDSKFTPVVLHATTPAPTTTTPSSVSTTVSASLAKKLNTTSHKIPPIPPSSSSVSIHIVKSPVPSPLMLLPSPHSNSSCITDDEMIDESLIGIKGK